MPASRAFVPGAGPLGPGEFYMPRPGCCVLPPVRPVPLTRFVARFRHLFDAELHVAKRLDLAEFENRGITFRAVPS